MANETMKLAAEIIKNPQLLDQYQGRYLIVMDQALTYPKYDLLNQAICLMAERGWQVVNMSTISTAIGIHANMMYALMVRITSGNESADKLAEQILQQVKGLAEQSKRIADVLDRIEQQLGSPTLSKPTISKVVNEIVNAVEQTNSAVLPESKQHPITTPDSYLCPKCHEPMIIRTVTKGENQGKQFYVCSNYPNCQGVLPV
jgi:hypothetical protein